MNRRIKLIFNAHADRGRAYDMSKRLQAVIERHGHADWAATEYPAHAISLAEEAAREGYDIVAAVGGDGTVHEVMNGIMRSPAEGRPLLGGVPVGSGNDFCSNVGIASDPEAAMRRLFEGETRSIDMGMVQTNTGHTEYFDNTLGIGFGAYVTLNSHKITRLQGFTMYLYAVIETIIRNHDAPKMVITTDNETIEKEIQYLVLCNGPREGGGFFVSPEAVMDDEDLNYALIEKVSRPMMLRIVPEVMKGTHGKFRQVKLGRFRSLKLTSDRPVAIHSDGEIMAGFESDVTEIEVKILPGHLKVVV